MIYNIYSTRSLLFAVILIFPFITNGQSKYEKLEKLLELEFNRLHNNESVQRNIYHFDSSNENHFLIYLRNYEHDSSLNVRIEVQSLIFQIASKSKDSSIRQQVVEDLVSNGLDSDLTINQFAFEKLLFFQENDFSQESKKALTNLFYKQADDHNFLLVLGIAQVKELIPQLKKLGANFDRTKYGWFRSTSWYANLALARMNEVEKLDNLISAVELELDPSLRVTNFLRFIGYTRQSDCIKLLQKYLESSETLPLNHGRPGLEFNQYALQYLTQYIEAFPIKSTNILFTKEELEIARNFLRKKNDKNE